MSLLLQVRDCWIMQRNTSISDRDEESRTVVDVGARQGKELASLAMHGREGTPLLLDRGGSVWWCSWLTHTERERGTCSCCVHAYGVEGIVVCLKIWGMVCSRKQAGEDHVLAAVGKTGKRGG